LDEYGDNTHRLNSIIEEGEETMQQKI